MMQSEMVKGFGAIDRAAAAAGCDFTIDEGEAAYGNGGVNGSGCHR